MECPTVFHKYGVKSNNAFSVDILAMILYGYFCLFCFAFSFLA